MIKWFICEHAPEFNILTFMVTLVGASNLAFYLGGTELTSIFTGLFFAISAVLTSYHLIERLHTHLIYYTDWL